MTFITKVEIKGFKSFGKKSVEVPFCGKLNSVVGPNGSGKSNIFDSICFALGATRMRSLRADKLSELVFNGGKNGSGPAKVARVSVCFDNSSKIFPVDENEVKITREVNEKGFSDFSINGKNVALLDVESMLSAAGIRADGYNIIMQGDITNLIKMSSEDRRKIIDEVAGISEYDQRKAKAVKDLDVVEKKIGDGRLVLSERKNYIDQVSKEREDALRYIELEKKLRVSKGSLVNEKLRKEQARYERMKEKCEEENKEKAVIDDRDSEIKAKLKSNQQRLSELNRKLIVSGRPAMSDLDELKSTVAVLSTRIENASFRINEVYNDVDANGKEKEAITLKKEEAEREIGKISIELDKLKRELSLRAPGSSSGIVSLSEKLAELNLEKVKLSSEVDIKRTITAGNEKRIQELTEKKKEYLSDGGSVEGELKKLNDVLGKLSKTLTELRLDRTKRQQKLQEFDQREENLLMGIRSLESSISSDQAKLQGLKDSDIPQVVFDILAQKFPGVHGMLSDIVKFGSSHELAIKAAAGKALYNIITDTEKEAISTIQYIKKNKLGRATFLPLSKVRSNPRELPENLVGRDGVIGRAVDLVDFDQKFRPAVEHVFAETLVVKDLAVAREIGIGGVRMVTLDGDLVERSGAMTGGYLKLPAASELKKKIDEANEKLGKLMSDNERLQKEKEDIASPIKSINQRIFELEPDYIDQQHRRDKLEEILAKNDIEALNKEIDELKKEDERAAKELGDIAKLLGSLDKEIGVLTEEKKKGSGAGDVSGSAIDGLVERKHELDVKIALLSSSKEQILQQMGALARKLSEMEAKAKELKIQKESDRLELEKAKQVLGQKLEAEKQLSKEFGENLAERDTLQGQMESLAEEEGKLQYRLKKIEDDLNKVNVEIGKSEVMLANLREELAQYIDMEFVQGKEEELLQLIEETNKTLGEMGTVNMKAIELFDKLNDEFKKLEEQVDKLEEERSAIVSFMDKIETRKKEAFFETFRAIAKNFVEVFAKMSHGGSGALQLTNEEDPFSAGLIIEARPEGKMLLNIDAMSGGEKVLTALAFVFSIQQYKPAPFYLFDEVDAALDKKNSLKLADYLNEFSKKAQFILISHNPMVTSYSDRLLGVTIDEDGISNIVGVKLKEGYDAANATTAG